MAPDIRRQERMGIYFDVDDSSDGISSNGDSASLDAGELDRIGRMIQAGIKSAANDGETSVADPGRILDTIKRNTADDGETFEDGLWRTLESIENSTRIQLHIGGEYSDWTPQEAFRELVQNWRDAIIETNNITSADLCVHREDASARSKIEIVYKAIQRGADPSEVEQCLGFIRFRGTNGAGIIDVVNINSTLQPWHLELGGTSKRGAEDQAGAHGEGLKLAALVLMRRAQNNRLRCQSGGFNWTFSFNKHGSLVVSLHKIKMARRQDEQDQEPGQSTFKIAVPEVVADRDVHFFIGEQRKGRDEKGIEVHNGPVQRTAFETWTKVALFLSQGDDENAKLVHTHWGDLLTAENLRGNIYLKSLLLCEGTKSRSASLTGRPLWFGYNFNYGQTNRERESVSTAFQESRAMCDILSGALSKKPGMIGTLVDILNNTETDYADVACAENYWPRDVGISIRAYLLKGEFANRWLYCGEDMNKNPRLRQAIEGIGRKPYEVSRKCWNILEKKKLVRNAEEEALWRFKHADEVPGPYPSFGTSVSRLLRACIRACPQAASVDVEIKFIQAGQLHLDVIISEDKKSLHLHERWLFMEDAVGELGLSGKMAEDKVLIFAVRNLFADVLEQLPRKDFHQEDDPRSSESHMKREINRAEERLVSYQEIEVRVNSKNENGRPGLCVEWHVNARPQDDNVMIEVQCHRASRCAHLRDEVLIAEDAQRYKMHCLSQKAGKMPETQAGELQPPACQLFQVPFQQGSHYASGLEEGEEYFFLLVTPTDPNSFASTSNITRVVAPPAAVRPNPSASASARPGNRNVAFPFPADITYGDGDSVIFVRHSDSPEPAGEIQSPGCAQDAAEGDDAAPEASNESGTMVTNGFISAMTQRDKMDVVKLLSHTQEDIQYVIGLIKGRKSLSDPLRKRRRMN